LASAVSAHGFVRNINIDGSIYPGFDPHRDAKLGMKRVAYGFQASAQNIDGTAAVQEVNAKALACNVKPTTPQVMASIRSGSNMDFMWTKWLPSHQGPMITWMAPYSGEISQVNVNKLEFFKIHEAGLFEDGTWATDRMIANKGVWNTTIPHDIKPGKYVVRHELISLHFATAHSNYSRIPGGRIAPQFYPSCYNVEVSGTGIATPKGMTLPGAYKAKEPGLIFDIFVGNKNYPIPGPPVYKPSAIVLKLTPNPIKIISVTGDLVKDQEYLKSMAEELKRWEQVTDYFQSIGG